MDKMMQGLIKTWTRWCRVDIYADEMIPGCTCMDKMMQG